MAGNKPSGSAPERVKSSVWQMPVALISIMTSPSRGPSRSTSVTSIGFPAATATAARVFMGVLLGSAGRLKPRTGAQPRPVATWAEPAERSRPIEHRRQHLPVAERAWRQELNSSLYIFPGMSYGPPHTQNVNFYRSDTSNGAARGSARGLRRASTDGVRPMILSDLRTTGVL